MFVGGIILVTNASDAHSILSIIILPIAFIMDGYSYHKPMTHTSCVYVLESILCTFYVSESKYIIRLSSATSTLISFILSLRSSSDNRYILHRQRLLHLRTPTIAGSQTFLHHLRTHGMDHLAIPCVPPAARFARTWSSSTRTLSAH